MAQEQKIGVTYIGRRQTFTDNIYGTGLYFEQGQTHFMPQSIAQRFLRHPEFEEATGKTAPKEIGNSATDEALEAARLEKERQEQEINRIQDVRDSVARMDNKDMVIEFVRVNFNQTLAKNAKLETLQAKAVELIDQFGVA